MLLRTRDSTNLIVKESFGLLPRLPPKTPALGYQNGDGQAARERTANSITLNALS